MNGKVKDKLRIAIFAVLVMLFLYYGRNPYDKVMDAEDVRLNTTKIELVYYENPNPRRLDLNFWRKPVFDPDKTTFIASLDKAECEDIIAAITDRSYLYNGLCANEPVAETIILYQNNGNMVVLYNVEEFRDCVIFDGNGRYVNCIGRHSGSFFKELMESILDKAYKRQAQ